MCAAEKDGTVIDLHVHSAPASSCSAAEVDDLIAEAKRIGLDGICLTDHHVHWEREQIRALRERHDFLVLRGNEITTDQGDMLVFGFEKDIQGIVRLRDLHAEVSREGGIIVVAHPFRGFLTFHVGQLGLTPESAAERELFRFVDAVEVLNSKVTGEENEFAAEVARLLGRPATGGSDAHTVREVGLYATRFPDPVRNEAELVAALKSGRCAPVAFRDRKRETR